MINSLVMKIFIITIIIILFAFLIVKIFMIRNDLKLSKKFSYYTISSKSDIKMSLFDSLIFNIISIIKMYSKVLNKNKYIVNYSLKYEKYIKADDMDKTSTVDFISTKLFLSTMVFIFYIIFQIIKGRYIDITISLLLIILGYFLYDIYLIYDYEKQKKLIEDDILKAIIIMNNAFKIGKNILEAIEIVMNELDGPISDEFKKIYKDLNFGLSLETAFLRFSKRTKIDDVKYITSSLTLLNKTGGNIVKVFDSVENIFFNNKKLKKELKSLTGASRFLYRFLLVLPIVFALIIFVINNDYFSILFNSTLGIIMLSTILFLYILYIIVIKKVTVLDL